jgi:hypothetical protein
MTRHRPAVIHRYAAFILGAALAFAATFNAPVAHASEADLLQRIDRLSQELDALKAELLQLKQDRENGRTSRAVATENAGTRPVASDQPPSLGYAAPSGPSPLLPPSSYGPPGLVRGDTTLFGYGEINYNRPRDTSQTQADLRRAVVGIGHVFDEKTELGMEIEWEHAVTSATDRGEAEIEQMWINHRLSDTLVARAGLLLMPVGFINERHEPPTFYGVERNFVETAIIPSTWREGGFMLHGDDFENALHWDASVTTGFDLAKWDATSADGRLSPLGSIHQELQFAMAKDPSYMGAVNYNGILGLTVGGSVFSGKAAQGTPNFAAPDARVTLWDLHGRWTPGPWDLSAVYAKGTISDIAAFNQTLLGNITLVPKEFWGGFGQAAYLLWSEGSYALYPFVRYERYNTAAGYAGLGAGLTPPALPTETVLTAGFNFKIHPNVVLKADYQKFRTDSSRDRVDLGLGFMY